MHYLQERCSICFDKHLEFCLQPCRDQFCFECFQRYMAEVVNNSWGLSITEVKCPVCTEVLDQDEWKQYATSEMIRRYDKYNQPYRSFARHCNECKEEVRVLEPPNLDLDKEERVNFMDTSASMLASLPHRTAALSSSSSSSPSSIRRGKRRENEVTDAAMARPAESSRKRRRLSARVLSSRDTAVNGIVTSLCQLERRPAVWRELQFKIVAQFPRARCHACDKDICMQCGEQTHHRGLSCQQHLRRMLERGTRSMDTVREDLRWKLEHSKPCPNCRVLIDRDDGCNRVDCLYCGYRFCWMCLDAWSEVEMGVPDVFSIQARMTLNPH
ncbi:hypothetical protein SYNPS1DRAFT_14247 [Syncephalis pseudoplumigaleata]|uniref:RING-type domain-containing protein n=1 Tax=Syncephalis pseudoplumigaleata TaxID=1712513 RepID=A0A4P9Z1N8_9FUNG|nr:hypothetical protein SYNPS1DRAFT_14247 [Syncephalis pseudoplumigaleata]|eukprot:RKP26393.1 hypothetical protein SYNPS1DRAFT_14247 [Syncephalis pseudoplumigaleata]